MTSTDVFMPIVGPRRHGVVEFGLELADTLRRNDSHVTAVDGLGRPVERDAVRGVHLQFTDRIFGRTPAEAAEAVRATVVEWAALGVRVTATLHDVPQASDGDHVARRTAAYATVCDVLHGVVVNSHHERLLLAEIGIIPRHLAMIPLPIQAGAVSAPAATTPSSVGVFGFLYPGKGHLEVMAALRGLPSSVGMVAIGEPSTGHDHLLADLLDRGREQGRTFTATGHVRDDRLVHMLRDVTVPVAHHRHVSASGSLNTWVAAGRRPLAPVNRYTLEMSERNPETFLLYEDDDDALRDAIHRAVADPGLTWLTAGAAVTPTAAEAADQYDRLLRRWHP